MYCWALTWRLPIRGLESLKFLSLSLSTAGWLQVKHGDEGKDARKAYVGMGMHALRGKERCRTYASVSSPEYEFWVTDEYVVTSGWDRRTAVGVTAGRWEEIRDAYGERI